MFGNRTVKWTTTGPQDQGLKQSKAHGCFGFCCYFPLSHFARCLPSCVSWHPIFITSYSICHLHAIRATICRPHILKKRLSQKALYRHVLVQIILPDSLLMPVCRLLCLCLNVPTYSSQDGNKANLTPICGTLIDQLCVIFWRTSVCCEASTVCPFLYIDDFEQLCLPPKKIQDMQVNCKKTTTML